MSHHSVRLPVAAVSWTMFWSLLAVHWIGLSTVWAAICTDPVCYYELDVSLYKTMMYRDEHLHLNQVQLNGTQLQVKVVHDVRTVSPDDVIITDGFTREVIVFNEQLPGPTIEVMEGAEVVITVANKLLQKTLTVHWHGILQNRTYFMDGAESVTQCPILPGQSFTYRFKAHPRGTHWYHAHMASMRLDGLFGMFIVHATPPKIPYFSISVNDWSHLTSEEIEVMDVDVCENGAVGPTYKIHDVNFDDCSFEGAELDRTMYTSSLFDGRNRWQNQPFPLKFYVVRTGQRYRFRMLNAGHIFPFQIQVDGHPMTIVASDGAEIEPIAVDSFFIVVAESIDFEIDANQTPGRYWIRAETQCSGAFARGILAYEGFEEDRKDPVSQPKECTEESPCRVFNCPFGRYPDGSNRTCIAMSDVRSTMSSHELVERFGLGSRKVIQLFMNFGMVAGSSINGRRFRMPTVPLFHDISTESDCSGRPCLDGCNCRCSKIVTLPYGQTVRLIVSNLQPDRNVTQNMYHTVHFHGHNFVVLAEKFPTYDPKTGSIVSPNSDITCDSDILCAHPRWTNKFQSHKFDRVQHPAVKDSIVIPVRGYVVLQFKTINPGYWMFHCHVDLHAMPGMTLVFKVAPDRFPDLPPGFPTCEGFEEDTEKSNKIKFETLDV